MPVIKSAKKKLRQDKKRILKNAKFEQTMKDAIKDALKAKTAKSVSFAQSLIDKAAKKHIVHNNKAARLKSRLSHATMKNLPKKEQTPTSVKPVAKKAAKKSSKNKGTLSAGRKKTK